MQCFHMHENVQNSIEQRFVLSSTPCSENKWAKIVRCPFKTYLSLSVWLHFNRPNQCTHMHFLYKNERKRLKIIQWTKITFIVLFWETSQTPKVHPSIFCVKITVFSKKVWKLTVFRNMYQPDNNSQTTQCLHVFQSTSKIAKNSSSH